MDSTILFILGCIPTRLAIVVGIILANPFILKVFSVIATIIAFGFWFIFLFGWRKTGIETNGAPIWWNMLRPIHGTLWGVAAYFAWNANKEATWRVILVDVCVGLISFTINRITTYP